MSTIQTWSRVMLALIMMSCGAFGQTASDLGEGLRAELTGTTGVTAIKWWGKTGRTYFLQSSETLLPGSWLYMPVVEVGSGSVRSWNLQTNAERMFVRLVYTDQANGGNASTADFDGDGISNAAEVAVGGPGTDPLLADSDWDGYNDGVELAAGTSPTNGQTNPGTTPPATGPLNPDSSYRNGLRLEMAAKYMQGEDYNSTFSTNPTFDCWAIAKHTAGSSQSIFAIQRSTTALLLPGCEEAFNQAGFLAPTKYLFQPNELSILRGIRSDYTVTGTGTQEGKSSKRSYRQQWEMQVQALASPAAPSWARRSIALLLLKDWSTTDVEAAGWLMLSSQNAKASTEMSRHCKPEGAKVVITPWLDPDVPDLASSSTVDSRSINRALYLFDTDIEPAEGMIGVVGDLVRSKKDDSHVKHFVTPKKSTELPQDYVELKCGVNTTDFDKYFEWEGDGQQGSPTNTYKVSRATTGDKAKKVKIKNKQTGTVVAEMHVWVVWCSFGTPIERPIQRIADANLDSMNGSSGKGYAIVAGYDFRCDILPQSITSTNSDEYPDLRGPPEYSGSIVSVPGAGTTHFVSGNDLADGAGAKWDFSRRVRCKVLNSDLLTKGLLLHSDGTIWDNQPTTEDSPTNYPSVTSVIGNDDASDFDESNDPYNSFSSADPDAPPSHNKGEMSSYDEVTVGLRDASGWDDDTFEVRFHYEEFVRLLIGQKWYVCSLPKQWKVHARLIKKNGKWSDNSSLLELNNTGY